MTKFLLLILPIVCMSFIMQDWVTVSLDEKVSLAFPVKPEEVASDGSHVWNATDEAGSKYLAVVVDFAAFGIDSATLAKQLQGTAFYKGFASSMLDKFEGATIVSEEITKLSGWPAYKMEVQLPGKSGAATKLYGLNVFIGTKVYSSSFYEAEGPPQQANRAKFFNSLTVK
jgi:hypothetical protein